MDDVIEVPIRRLPHAAGLDLPAYATVHSAGMDIQAAVEAPVELEPSARILVPSGIQISLPEGYEAQVRPRSGLAVLHGVTVPNTPGTIDADYRGEIKVILINHGTESCEIRRGERIAQLVIARHARVLWTEETELDDTTRGEGGFGHTGR